MSSPACVDCCATLATNTYTTQHQQFITKEYPLLLLFSKRNVSNLILHALACESACALYLRACACASKHVCACVRSRVREHGGFALRVSADACMRLLVRVPVLCTCECACVRVRADACMRLQVALFVRGYYMLNQRLCARLARNAGRCWHMTPH